MGVQRVFEGALNGQGLILITSIQIHGLMTDSVLRFLPPYKLKSFALLVKLSRRFFST